MIDKQSAKQHKNHAAKMPGSMGVLDEWYEQLCILQQDYKPTINACEIFMFTATHQVASDEKNKVSVYSGRNVFADRVISANIVSNHSTSNVLAQVSNLKINIDCGIDGGKLLPNFENNNKVKIHHHKIRENGAGDIRFTNAMTLKECQNAIELGKEMARYAKYTQKINAVTCGEAGIGNTTASSAILSLLFGWDYKQTAGPGTGIDMLEHGLTPKINAIKQACLRAENVGIGYNVNNVNPIDILRSVGGIEIAAMTGFLMECPKLQIAVLVDGYIVTISALLAVKLDPTCLQGLFFSHGSEDEPCGIKVINEISTHIKYPLRAGLRLGEGSAAIISYPLLQAAANIANIATGDESRENLFRYDQDFLKSRM
jgi:nicotinate-nucleotide--dimethylbenzimidazole phosphoribosyltransferase